MTPRINARASGLILLEFLVLIFIIDFGFREVIPNPDNLTVFITLWFVDAYVTRKDVISLDRIWPGAQVRYVDSGHVGAFIFHNNQFR
jgi:hypothetical protein